MAALYTLHTFCFNGGKFSVDPTHIHRINLKLTHNCNYISSTAVCIVRVSFTTMLALCTEQSKDRNEGDSHMNQQHQMRVLTFQNSSQTKSVHITYNVNLVDEANVTLICNTFPYLILSGWF